MATSVLTKLISSQLFENNLFQPLLNSVTLISSLNE